MLSGLVLITKTTGVEPTEVENCSINIMILCQIALKTRTEINLLTIYWRTMWHLSQSLLQIRELVFPQKR